MVGNLRSFQVMAEYLVYHTDDGEWKRACGQLWSGQFEQRRGFIFEPIRLYLDGEWKRAGLARQEANVACGTASMAERHFFSRSQWCLPTEEHYRKLQAYANEHGRRPAPPYEEYHDAPRSRFERDRRADYEYLRADYEYLRYVFNNPGRVSSVWQIPPAPRNGHLTPKPEALLERIIETTSNPGDLVLDPMMGSGTTGAVAVRLGRRFVGSEINRRYYEMARKRIEAAQREMVQKELFRA